MEYTEGQGNPEGTNMATLMIPSVDDMDDETLMKHLELRHEDDLRLTFKPEPGRTERRLAAPGLWRTYHNTMHRLYSNKYDHRHRDVTRG